MINIALIDNTYSLSGSQIQVWLPAFQAYVSEHLKPAWNVDARLHFFSSKRKADPSMWWVLFSSKTGYPGALGYHADHPNGLPYAVIGVRDDKKYGASISVTATHELAEMLVDPNADQVVAVNHDGKLWAKEAADAVEADEFALIVNGVACSNFVLPNYFIAGSTGPWDAMGLLSGPCPDLMPGGYMSYRDAQGHWHDVTARIDGRHSYRFRRPGRRDRRAAVR